MPLKDRFNQHKQLNTVFTPKHIEKLLVDEIMALEIKDLDFKLIPEYDGNPLHLADFIRNNKFIYDLYCRDNNPNKNIIHTKLVLTVITKLKDNAKIATYDKEFTNIDDILNFLKKKYQDTRTREQLILNLSILDKTEFLKNELKFLGYIVTQDGLGTDQRKIDEILKFPIHHHY